MVITSARRATSLTVAIGIAALGIASIASTTVTRPAFGATANVVTNSSFENAVSGVPSCWQLGGSGTATASLTQSTTAHSGAGSGQVSISGLSSGGNRKIVISQRTAGCAPAVTAGHTYQLGVWYQATSPILLSVYYRTSGGMWQWWTQSSWFPASNGWAWASYTTPVMPSGAQALSFGPSMSANGTLLADDAVATDGGVPVTPTPTTSTPVTYESTVLADQPVAMWDMRASGSTEADVTGHGNAGSYVNGTPTAASMPNGDKAADFNGTNQYMTVPSAAPLSIPNTTHQLTWEAWIRPDVLQFPTATNGYTDFLGKCGLWYHYCEYEGRMYNTTNSENRCNRLSAYVFNLNPSSAGYGSAGDWQPNCNMLQAGHWYHVVGEYRTDATPYNVCNTRYPGTIDIWVNGVKWNQSYHGDTGCMSQYSIVPQAGPSPFVVGTLAQYDYFFQGAIGKVAVYDKLLSQTQINAHYAAMTGQQPSGSCANTCTLTMP